MQQQLIPISKIRQNTGQVPGLPKTPFFIKDKRFDDLVESIKADPEMLELRELIVFPFEDTFVIIGGDKRFRAMKALKYKECPCKVLPPDTTAKKLRAYAIKDNVLSGEKDEDLLSTEWDIEELAEWGLDVDFDFDEKNNKPKQVDLIPFKKVHYLFSFHPDVFLSIKDLLESIINTDGVEHEQSSN